MAEIQDPEAWDPFGFGVPNSQPDAPVQQFSSRRAARDALSRGGAVAVRADAASALVAPREPEIEASWSFADIIAEVVAPQAIPGDVRSDPVSRRSAASAAPTQSTGFPTRRANTTKGRAKKRFAKASRAAIGTPPPIARAPRSVVVSLKAFGPTTKKTHKNPISVVTTMVAVAGMFAVAGLPAYATTLDQHAKVAATAAATINAQSVIVDARVAPLAALRDGYVATSPEQLAQMSRDAARAALNQAYNASGARALGDDYPWPYELADIQGGGLSPLNYFYRECVDFVAWRLNRDAGSFQAPFKWVWSNLTPSGGNASQWLYAWQNHGWQTSNTPIVGSVAWFNGNHVAYVTRVNADGTIFIEEYNHGGTHVYGQRTIPATQVAMFLYPPPR